ncbi:acetylcholine receptor subunit alpha-like [Argopecten irradians]|uniref:acetylcholine receptor subunit alpha-like n=1 Tax=Argopecten irradians TaxID=31199 RepID=UPI00371C8D59
MKGDKRIIILFIICHCHMILPVMGSVENMTRLMADVFSNYSRDVRPAKDTGDTVTISTTLFLLSILDVDEVAGSITLSGGLTIFWLDYRLAWQPADYGGISYLMVNSSKIWVPNLFLMTSSAEMEKFSLHEYDIRIRDTGLLNVSAGKLMRSTCSIDMTYFPVDSQKCSMIIVPWGYLPTEVNLTTMYPTFETRYFSPNGEWSVDDTSAEMFDDPDYVSNAVVFTLTLKRRSAYFIISMLVPVYILCFLNPFVFLLPASSGERISYTITMFLSLAVYMTLVGDNMPKVSEPMAGISYFLLVSMIFSCALTIITIFTLRWHGRNDASRFPKWLRQLVFLLKKKEKTTYPIKQCSPVNIIKAQNHEQKESRNLNIGIILDGSEKDENIGSRFTEPDKDDIINFIDNALFGISELVVVGLCFGFTYGYYR